jgi:hypothetical protein
VVGIGGDRLLPVGTGIVTVADEGGSIVVDEGGSIVGATGEPPIQPQGSFARGGNDSQ